jgi:hypothetical protein
VQTIAPRFWKRLKIIPFPFPLQQKAIFKRRRGTQCALQGLRKRKNRALFVAGMITDLFVPSSLTSAVFETQLVGALIRSARSKAKPSVSADGQETITSVAERPIESVGIVPR